MSPCHDKIQEYDAVQIILLVPTAPPRLIQLAAASSPHKTAPLDVQCMYLRALASLAEGPGGATVRDGLLAAIVNQLICIDVEIKWQDIVDAIGERKTTKFGCVCWFS